MRVLLATVEGHHASKLRGVLRSVSMPTDIAPTPSRFAQALSAHEYDIVLVDEAPQGYPSQQLIADVVKTQPGCKIIALTTVQPATEVIRRLELGADDCMVKPLDLRELVARMRTVQRRSGISAEPQLLRAGIALDPYRHLVSRSGQRIDLCPKEFAVLELLLRANGGIVTTDQIFRRVWGDHVSPNSQTVRVTMCTLRRRLGPPPVIETIVGIGYRLGD